MKPNPASALVIIATYNERLNLADVVAALLQASGYDILIIDDGSPDGTGEVADDLARAEPRIAVVHRDYKQGVASAHILGFRHALEHGYEWVVEMDADFSHPPAKVPDLLAAAVDADIVVGSRSVPGGRIIGRSWIRDLLTRCGSAYARVVLGLEVRDCTGGFRCTRRSALESIDLDRVFSSGYGFQFELNHAWSRAGFTFAELPIVFTERRAGRSKMSYRVVVEALHVVLRLRLGLQQVALRSSYQRMAA
jgi:dolichol-phosphate mannosyltransferase